MGRSRRPYLIRAIYDWACDDGQTPHLLVDAGQSGVFVPQGYVKDGRITLNIGPEAVAALNLHSDPISFTARFGGKPFDVRIPPSAVVAVFAKETGEGIIFGEAEAPPPDETPQDGTDPAVPRPAGRPHLRVVK